MEYREIRPPRSQRPGRGQSIPPPSYPDTPSPPTSAQQQQQFIERPSLVPNPNQRGSNNVSFQAAERGDRTAPLDDNRIRSFSAYQQHPLPPTPNDLADIELAGNGERVSRKKSLVKPEREKIEPGHRQWYYRNHAAQMEDETKREVHPSRTGNMPQREPLRRGKSLLARDEDVSESGLALFKRGATLRRNRRSQLGTNTSSTPEPPEKSPRSMGCFGDIPGPKDGWVMYCYALTFCVPSILLVSCGIRSREQQRAWREKIGLLSIISCLMAGVGFLTFGFTQTVCGTPPNRFETGTIETGSVIIHGQDYDFSHFDHPEVGNFNGHTNPLFVGNWSVAGADISFMFQNTGGACHGLITAAGNSTIPTNNGDPEWVFPCNVYNQFGSSGVNKTNYGVNTTCHTSSQARNLLAQMQPQGQVYFTWDDVKNPDRNLAVFQSNILDFDLFKWLDKAEVDYPDVFDEFVNPNGTYNGRDITMQLYRNDQKELGLCMQQLITVGFIDTNTIGCVASEVVLWLSLIFIIGVVAIKFGMAVIFGWFLSWRLGAFSNETYEQRMKRAAEIENWTDDIYRPAPSRYRPNVQKNGAFHSKALSILPSTSRFTPSENPLKGPGPRPTTLYNNDTLPYSGKRMTTMSSSKLSKFIAPDSPAFRNSRSSTSLENGSQVHKGGFSESPCPFPLHNVLPQPSPDYQPFNFPLAHTICLVTAYSESEEGLRTTLDSIATTDYPNSHKLLMVIADGHVKGAGNSMATPDIVLSMMKELIMPIDEVEPHSYVAIADGHKRHNMAKVYAGFYDYDDATVERSKQQRVPIILVAKCGNPLEKNDKKPGNRGKRDSQVLLMSFLQKVMFDERMTTFEYEFFNSIWRITGVSPDRYEMVLCVDADTKVFPDSLTRMVACMVHDEEIMGLCGETKIGNKAETWVTMIQVFEYYISHHLSKAFESMFGGVTCLPGCFSMYRIKAPKGNSTYWVPILANPDVVEHYSENVVDTLHKKNLLLLGEDRYLTTLMLKTFPKRKMIFCTQAVCKTVVPDSFKVLLSQRRRWINSTVHNLAELLLVRDLCGTFCFSMQFVVFMELAGTLVLPAAISFTIYLIVISIIPGGANTTIPLILLGIILGLPGLLIVVTSRKIAYVGWMLVYLISLPIWNFVLPVYAFWHFDDFSWGETRRVAGGDKDGHEGDKDGEFDSSHIVMKRWAEFERERRWKSGTVSRDSTYYDMRSHSPKRPESMRQSLISSSDVLQSGGGHDNNTAESQSYNSSRPRHDSAPLLVLPTPLSVNKTTPSVSSGALSRNSEENSFIPDLGSQQRLIPSPTNQEFNPYGQDAYGPTNAIASTAGLESNTGRVRTNSASQPILRHGAVSNMHPGETPNPYRNFQGQTAFEDDGTESSDETQSTNRTLAQQQTVFNNNNYGPRGGVSLADSGPIAGTDGGVRRVSRPSSRRPSSQGLPTNRYSRSSLHGSNVTPSSNNSQYYNLPPGAAPPRSYVPDNY